MKTAVIIVNYNDIQDTVNYVKKIEKYEIIDRIVVVDNLSTVKDAFTTLKKLENEKTIVIESDKNGGYNYGNNFGIKYLESKNEKYDYFIISNPDIDIEQKAIKNSLEVLEKNVDVAVVAPRMFNIQDKPMRRGCWKTRTFLLDVIHSTRFLEILFYSILRKGEYTEKEYSKNELQVEAISGAFFIIKNEILQEIGLFDEKVFLFYEEDILSYQLKKLGYKIISLNSEKFIHYESQSIGKSFNYYQKIKQLYKSKIYFHKTYQKINKLQEFLFYILNICRKLELFIEIPIRKILKK